MDKEQAKIEIIKRFKSKVQGKKVDLASFNSSHDGKEGHWLETRMEIKINNLASSDIYGFEMKKNSNKITFGDWSADFYLFKNSKFFTRADFIKTFGTYKKEKNRWSWSGKVFPKINVINDFGQTLKVNNEKGIDIIYLYDFDKRNEKETLIPLEYRLETRLAYWKHETLKKRVNKKFGDNGWFICTKDENGIYQDIRFGEPFDFDFWIKHVEAGDIYCDSGMYHDANKPNQRPYSSWRAQGYFWHNLAKEIYN